MANYGRGLELVDSLKVSVNLSWVDTFLDDSQIDLQLHTETNLLQLKLDITVIHRSTRSALSLYLSTID